MSDITNDAAQGRRTSHVDRRSFTIRILAGPGLCLVVALVAARYSETISSIDTRDIMARIRAFLAILLGSSAPVVRTYCLPAVPLLPPPSLKHAPGKPLLYNSLNDLSFAGDTSYAVKAAIGDVEIFEREHRSPVFRDAGHTSLYDTQFRIGSVTKLFTVLALLLSPDKFSWDAPITRYVDGLSNAYEDVTIRALAGHTSGLGFWVCLIPSLNREFTSLIMVS